ncbi:MAG: HAD family hydrolase [Verrucomicrobiota bacterium]
MEPLLLSTDFDGTILNHDLPAPMAPSFFDWIENERERREVIWVINTGRDWDSLQIELEQRQARFTPDWVVLVEREIHRLESKSGSLVSLEHWNQRCTEIHADLFTRANAALQATRERLTVYEDLTVVNDIGSPLGIIAKDNAQADALEPDLQPMLEEFPEMHTVRNDIYFRFAHQDFHKGSCLETLLQETGLRPENCFAAGDNVNDLHMLNREYAHYLTCPSNALPQVKAKVKKQGGYIATLPADQGIVQALNYFFRTHPN